MDGVDVREQSAEALRQKIAVVPQKAVLFEGTIRDNLRWGDPVSYTHLDVYKRQGCPAR